RGVHARGGGYHARRARIAGAVAVRERGVTRPWPRWRRRALVGLAGSGVLTLLWLGAPFALRRLQVFRVRQVELVGVRNLAPDAVIAALRLGPGASVFSDTRLLADRVRGLAGVAGARVVGPRAGALSVELLAVGPRAPPPG